MRSKDFPRNRYDPGRFTAAFDDAEVTTDSSGEVYAVFNYDGEDIEVHFPDCDSASIPERRLRTARTGCQQIQDLDNLVQDRCEQEANNSVHDARNFKLYIAYLKVYDNRLEVRYWGKVVNTEWDAVFTWDASVNKWVLQNLSDTCF